MRHLQSFRGTWQVRAVALSAIWGTSFLFMKVGVRSFEPFDVTSGRIAIGAVTLVIVLVASHQALPRSLRLWWHLAVAGLLLNAVPFTLIAWGEQRISSVAAGIWNATTPLFVVPVAFLMVPSEHPTRAKVTGLAVGFLGVAVVFGAWGGLSGSHLSGDFACLGASACYGLGTPYAKRFVTRSSEPPIGLAAGQLIAATVELADRVAIPRQGSGSCQRGERPVRRRPRRLRDRRRLRPQLLDHPRSGRVERLARHVHHPHLLDPSRDHRSRRGPPLERARRGGRHPRRRRDFPGRVHPPTLGRVEPRPPSSRDVG